MPNWVTNNIIVNNKEDFEKLKKVLLNENEKVDFNKLIPMPQDLHITAGGCGWKTEDKYGFGGEKLKKQIEFQQNEFEEYLNQFLTDTINQDDFVTCVKGHIKTVKTDYIEKLKEIYDIDNIDEPNVQDHFSFGVHHSAFEQLIRGFYNTKKYGSKDWYDWSITNWGTKWNASETTVNDYNIITFETAWSCPFEIISKLATIIPNFTVAYADEDLGANYGVVEFIDGVGNRIEDFDNLDYSIAKYVATIIKGYDCRQYWHDCIDGDEENIDFEEIEHAENLIKKFVEDLI